jgi:hypothetical protein
VHGDDLTVKKLVDKKRGRPYLLGYANHSALRANGAVVNTRADTAINSIDAGGDESNYLAHYSILRFPHNTPNNIVKGE